MAGLSLEEVEHIAELARLSLTDEEKELFREQLSDILEYAEMLKEVDTTDVPPMFSAIPVQNVMYPDEVKEGLSTDDALSNAPEKDDDYFRVRPILE